MMVSNHEFQVQRPVKQRKNGLGAFLDGKMSFIVAAIVCLLCVASSQAQSVRSCNSRMMRLGEGSRSHFATPDGDSETSNWNFGRWLPGTIVSTRLTNSTITARGTTSRASITGGVSGYAIAVAWLGLGLLILLFVCCKCLCKPRLRFKRPRSRAYYWTPRIIVFGLSVVAVGCSVVLFIACKKFTSQAYNVEDVVVEAAQNATDNIHSVTATLDNVKGIVLPYNKNLYNTLSSTETKLNSLAVVVNEKVFINRKTYQKIFKIIESVLLVVTSLNLLLIVLGFASTFLRWRRFFYLIIVVTWIFTAITWLMFGFFLAVHFLADDTCLAFKEYLQDPQNTTLDALLPCADLASSHSQYLQVRKAMKNVLTSATDQLLFYTKGSTSLTGVCDPIGPAPTYKYTGICANDTLPIGELANLVEPFVCNDTPSVCIATFPFYVNQSTYNGISAMTRASQSTLDAFPLMEALTNCSLVTNPIDTMVNVRCGPAKVAINRIWISFAVLSSVVVLLIIFWCLANRRNTEQRYLTSITPQEQPFDARAYTVIEKSSHSTPGLSPSGTSE